jgi:hypothetical protein
MVDEEKIIPLGQGIERTVGLSEQVAHLDIEIGILAAEGNSQISRRCIVPLPKGGGENENGLFAG